MAKGTYIHKGDIIDYVNGGASAIEYNEVIPLVTRIGIAAEKISVGATGAVRAVGVFELPSVNNAAFSVGDQLYWDAAAGNLTKTSSGNTPAGWATESKLTAGTTARIKIG